MIFLKRKRSLLKERIELKTEKQEERRSFTDGNDNVLWNG